MCRQIITANLTANMYFDILDSSNNAWDTTIVYYITRGETERLHECEVCCPSETRAAITGNAFAAFCFE